MGFLVILIWKYRLKSHIHGHYNCNIPAENLWWSQSLINREQNNARATSLLQVHGVPHPLVKAIIHSLRTGVVHRWLTLITWFSTGYGLRHAPRRDRDCLLLRLRQQWTTGHAVVQCGRGGCNGAGCRYNWQICTRHNSVNNSLRNCWSTPTTLCWAISYTGEEPLAHCTIWADAGSHPGSYRWIVCRGLCTTPRRCFPILSLTHHQIRNAGRRCRKGNTLHSNPGLS